MHQALSGLRRGNRPQFALRGGTTTALPQAVEAPRPSAGRHKIEEQEAIRHRDFTPIEKRPDVLREVSSEIGRRHLTAEKKRDGTRKQAKKQKRPENHLNDPRDS